MPAHSCSNTLPYKYMHQTFVVTCMQALTYVCLYTSTYVCMHAFMTVCMHACTWIRLRMFVKCMYRSLSGDYMSCDVTVCPYKIVSRPSRRLRVPERASRILTRKEHRSCAQEMKHSDLRVEAYTSYLSKHRRGAAAPHVAANGLPLHRNGIETSVSLLGPGRA